MSRAQELRQRIYNDNVKDKKEIEALGQKYYDYVLDVIDALSCSTSINNCIEIKLEVYAVMGSDRKCITTTTNPKANNKMKTKAGKEVKLNEPDIVADTRAYKSMASLFEKEEGYNVDIDGGQATVTMMLPTKEEEIS